MNLSGKQVLVLGLGESGLAMAQWLARAGAVLRVADTRSAPPSLAALQEHCPAAQFIAGAFEAELLTDIDVVLVSPGLAPQKELALIVPAAAALAIPVWGEMELFALALAELREQRGYAPKVIAITGTNGKTTVTSMVGLLCQRAGLSTRVAGNISPAVLDVLRLSLEQEDLPQVWVLELSSFQLHTCFSLAADAAVVLNISQDHLDWHGSMAAYCADKARIFGPQTVQVLNRDEALVMAMAKPTGSVVTFGTDVPDLVDDLGLQHESGMAWLVSAVAAEDAPASGRRRKKDAPVDLVAVLINRLMPSEALQIRGAHNAANALAALALCRAIGLPLAPLLHGLREYKGEPHRVELIHTIIGVDYIDDSKGTNVGATVAALRGLGQSSGSNEKTILLIAGGVGKGQDFTPLADVVARYAKAVFLIGQDRAALHAVLSGGVAQAVPLHDCLSLEQAVAAAAAQAQSGDTVLLSPACASFDMFRNYAHRAEVFAEAVREQALASGEIC
ncbi:MULTISPECIES: UDP-N-acetylmuramoyl-L-alanine--D-glutamate ligase [unclassified Undibacterium]|uniref:UDP-N-acetylmuramoyl-L-alanine--D-glutamate ligase n=1 Tax=unclassified Undibacterium TaxID=2630295 RepID=UPI002AC9A35A|nr:MULTISPECIES: UDP-N-acetylmuramoyl-L-alanine--D-glutamate ligase [unclassified Undibacterium]MEB0138655.1 UDP-N-acetylmuramoyl-L-alanine--D-glutamate ligase [Undibacterium sp. CCC2.1]MEB0171456.1 UDP-N-acetylmuramoyl-L-alanine--D-glutamate ligase [Undibacterium sp. CCC1.1]MEB0175786.1 UDP-N-acetylmuramoyl-L-alanine--D-glutamate ligase [Undibacterium sp. CCC3.4]MEB0214385.1 UDP-N-acetylmuramoyl-L-alanine--D-glutamate ligase [Undibacterium sp. 5I2]WPX44254.1 UDP-N-acetylmuramoyl-L-alanine--D-